VRAARKEDQRQLDRAIAEAGIPRILSTIPPYYLTVFEDLEDLAEIASTYRARPRVVAAGYDDVPPAQEAAAPTEALEEFVHRAGYLFSWDDETRLWCVSGVRDGFPDDTEDVAAPDRRTAVIEALRYLVED
jgi:hypothetical protein